MQTYLGDHTVEVTRHDVNLMQIIVTSTFSEKHPHTLDCIYEECEVGFHHQSIVYTLSWLGASVHFTSSHLIEVTFIIRSSRLFNAVRM